MLQVECRDCGAAFSLRGWIEPEDLIGTQWEGYTKQDIVNAEKENPRIFDGLDPWENSKAMKFVRFAVHQTSLVFKAR